MRSLTDVPYELYKVLDTETNEFWTANNGKAVWMKINHAKASWTQRNYKERIKFNDQERFKIVRYTTQNWLMEMVE